MLIRQEINQRQELLINLAMKQAFHIMQLPLPELAQWLQEEIESNPLLEIEERRRVGKFEERVAESPLVYTPSLYEHLLEQLPLLVDKGEMRELVHQIIGHLNAKGFLDIPLQEVAPSVPLPLLEEGLSLVQQLGPPGIGARNIQEALLIQLKEKGSFHARQIVEHHFDLLLHNRLPVLARALGIASHEVERLIQEEIAPLDLYPGYRFHSREMSAIIPDLFLHCIDGKWKIDINCSLLPEFRLSSLYGDLSELSYVRQQISAGRWLKKAVEKRGETLYKIAAWLLKKQAAFFEAEGRGTLVALSHAQAAQDLGLHESTVARAVSHKFIACPQGVFKLRSFFQQGVKQTSGEKLSRQTLKELLLRAIEQEDKARPLSDEALVHRFQELGISCARRTVAKYRASLNIAPASSRRSWH